MIFKIDGKLYIHTLVIFTLVIFGGIYYLYLDDDIQSNFFKLGYSDDITFLHKKINTREKLIEMCTFCIFVGFITEYFNKLITFKEKYKINFSIHKTALYSLIVNINKRFFAMLLIYITVTSNIQFVLCYLLGTLLYDIPYMLYN